MPTERGTVVPEETPGIFRQAENVVARQIAGQFLLIPLHQTGVDVQKVYLLNETSAAVWAHLSQPRPLDELVALLSQEYEGPGDAITADVAELLDDLVSRGFVRLVRANE